MQVMGHSLAGLAVLGIVVYLLFKTGGGFPLGSITADRQQFINLLKEQLGKPYKIPGAVAPNTFDCASLGQYCYLQIGISISRAVTEQSREAPNVRKFNPYAKLKDVAHLLKPGDAIGLDFNSSDPLNRFDHVVWYIGNGKVIQATGGRACPNHPSSRCKVVEDPLSRFTGSTVRSIYSYFNQS